MKRKIPFLGLCFGFQLAVITFAREVLGIKDANSTEIDPDTKEPVIDLLPEQKEIDAMGGTMRLGLKSTIIKEGTLAYRIYGKKKIYERHRHRYEVNHRYIDRFESNGLIFSGVSEDGRRMEIAEMDGHPFFIGTQFHPEFLSRPFKPSPIFIEFLKATSKYKDHLI